MHIFLLTLLFAFAGVMAIIFHRIVPDGATIRKRFPIKRARLRDIALPLVIIAIGTVLWFSTAHANRTAIFQSFIISLLALESGLLLLMRRFQSTISLSFMAAICGIIAFALSWTFRLPALDMLLFVFGTLGAWTLTQRLGFLNVPFLMVIVLGLTVFDFYHISAMTTSFTETAPATSSQTILLVSVGNESLGIGDFIFLSFCTLTLIARFGNRVALVFLATESLILLITGFIPATNGFFFPYLLVMTPIFLLTYGIAWLRARRRKQPRQGLSIRPS